MGVRHSSLIKALKYYIYNTVWNISNYVETVTYSVIRQESSSCVFVGGKLFLVSLQNLTSCNAISTLQSTDLAFKLLRKEWVGTYRHDCKVKDPCKQVSQNSLQNNLDFDSYFIATEIKCSLIQVSPPN